MRDITRADQAVVTVPHACSHIARRPPQIEPRAGEASPSLDSILDSRPRDGERYPVSSAAIGIDFGTSNSALATCDAQGQVQLLETAGGKGATVPTVLFFPSYEKDVFVGHDAIDRYLETGFDGRFVQSIKAYLPSESFSGTHIRGRFYGIEELIAAFLRRFVQGAEAVGKIRLDGPIVLGRPARFSDDPAAERLAAGRLARAAELAGLKDVQFLIEPIAAALAYESSLERDETVFVADLGGGTSDFAVMRVGPSYRGSADRRSSILASGGLSVAGDRFDGEIVRAKVLPLLGWGTEYDTLNGPARVPNWMYLRLLRWNHVSFLKSAKNLDFLRRVAATSHAKAELQAFLRLVDEDLGYSLYRAIERAKRDAAQGRTALIVDEEHALPVEAELTPDEFVEATVELVDAIRSHAQSVLSDAQLDAGNVDAVFITGGTGLLPIVRQIFEDMFDGERVRSRQAFTSVADGLARGAWSQLGTAAEV